MHFLPANIVAIWLSSSSYCRNYLSSVLIQELFLTWDHDDLSQRSKVSLVQMNWNVLKIIYTEWTKHVFVLPFVPVLLCSIGTFLIRAILVCEYIFMLMALHFGVCRQPESWLYSFASMSLTLDTKNPKINYTLPSYIFHLLARFVAL